MKTKITNSLNILIVTTLGQTMQSSAKILLLMVQTLALIAIKVVDGTSSSLDSSDKSDLLPPKNSVINYESPILSKEILDSDLIDLYDEDKRAQWNNLQGNIWPKYINRQIQNCIITIIVTDRIIN